MQDQATHVGGEDLDPARFLLGARVLEAEGHALLIRVPALHLLPLERDHLVLEFPTPVSQDHLGIPNPSQLRMGSASGGDPGVREASGWFQGK